MAKNPTQRAAKDPARLIVLFQKYLEEFINQEPESWSPQSVQFPFLSIPCSSYENY